MRSRSSSGSVEIIVADCGSTDGTARIAKDTGLCVTTNASLTSRARACNAGAAVATGDALLFLHADSRVPARFDRLIEEALRDPRVGGGAFEFALDGPELRLRLVEAVNRLRYRCHARYYGDQGIFVRRAVFEAAGGFPDIPIMEDAHLCRKISAFGTMPLVHTPMLTSPRRFYNGGILRTFAFDVLIGVWDFMRFNPNSLSQKYRRDNQRRGRRPAQSSPHRHVQV